MWLRLLYLALHGVMMLPNLLSVYGQTKQGVKTVNRKVERKVTKLKVCIKCALFGGSIVTLSLIVFMRC